MPRLVRLATLSSFLFHGVLILAGRYRASYDAYVHMFFADHYRMDWWSLWDERWYTGFPVTSYPPLVHQVMGTLSHLIGLEASFALVLWTVVTLIPLAVYYFSRVFVGKASAGYAALGAAFLPSVYLTAHIFGQLPFLAGTLLALFAAACLSRFLEEGGVHNFALSLALMTTTMATHHAVLLLQPFLVFAVVLKFLFKQGFPTKFVFSNLHAQLMLRLLLWTLAAVFLSLLVLFPFWDWGRTQTLQTPIDHASRHNFFSDPLAPILFFLPMYGPLALLIPLVVPLARKRDLAGLGIAFSFLFLLGLGGTTPLPGLLFGKSWEWLTYDRFAFWATLFLLPFLGRLIVLARRRYSRATSRKVYAALAVSSLIVATFSVFVPLQPGAVDMDHIVEFLEQEDRASWRYLTFGFGDQLALLSTLTTATTIDGSYHTARSLPELRTSGIAQIDTALWFPNGLSALDPILQEANGHGVRWAFVNVAQYTPVLERSGWLPLTYLKGGVQVWENPVVMERPASNPRPVQPFASFAWGTFPLLSLAVTLSLTSLKVFPIQAEKVLRTAYQFLLGLIPLALCFWYYKTIGEFPHSRVYFTYDHALLFVTDALVILAVLIWGCVEISRPNILRSTREKVRSWSSFYKLAILLLLFSTVSALWSTDWRTSLYISFHLWLVFLFILSLRAWKDAWRPLMLGLCAALAFQLIAGFTGFTLQSTHFLSPLNMIWPGLLDPSVRGASVVQLQDGLRILRAYGTLPHPNILGGFALLCLLGPASLFITARRTNIPALLLYSLGIVLIMETFSRSAWLGLLVFLFVLWLKSKHLDRQRFYLLFAASVLAIILTLFPLQELVLTRMGSSSVQTEQLSTFGRSWLNGQALGVIQANPINGVGIGSFILQLAGHAIEGAPIEPVHNVFLLIGSELGILGMLITAILIISMIVKGSKVRTSQATLASAALAGIGMIGLFDHYLWSIAPGRLMLGLALGLWAGQVVNDNS